MVFVDPEELKWLPFVKTWMTEKCGAMREETRDYLLELFNKYVENGLRFIQKKCTQAMPQVNYIVLIKPCNIISDGTVFEVVKTLIESFCPC